MTDIGITFTYTSEEVKANVACSQDMTCDDVIRQFIGFLAVAGYHNDSIIGCLEQVAEEYKDEDEDDDKEYIRIRADDIRLNLYSQD